MANIIEILMQQIGVKQASKEVDGYDKKLTKLIGTAAKYTAISAGVIALAKKTVDAYGAQELAERKLEQALGRKNQALLDSAAALQRNSIFGDEEIIQQQAFLASLDFTEKQIKQMMPAILDLAAATGMDLTSATKNVAKTFSGMQGELGELIPQLKTLTAEEMKAGGAVKLLNDLFEGQAAAAADTMTGAIQQAKNAVGDASESIGGLLAPVVTKVAKGFGWAAENVTAFVDSMTVASRIQEQFNALDPAVKVQRLTFQLEQQLLVQKTLTEGSKAYKATQAAILETVNKLTQATKERQQAIQAAAEAEFLASHVSAELMENQKKQVDFAYNGVIPALQTINLEQADLSVTSGEYAKFMTMTYAPGVADALNQTADLLATVAGENKELVIRSMRLAEFAALASTGAGIMKAYEQGGVMGFLTGTSIALVGATQIASIEAAISQARSAATGMDEVFDRPTFLQVGDRRGGERVQVTPAEMTENLSPSINLHFHSPVTSREFIRNELMNEMKKAMRLGFQ